MIPVPTPAVQVTPQLGGALQLSWLTAPGLTYQLQYKTNLAQDNWLPIGEPLVATNSTSSLLDTNSATMEPQRFYRLALHP